MGFGTQADRHGGPHPRRGTSRRARVPGSAAESGCVLVARLARWLSHECGDMCGVLTRRSSVVTRVHVARGCRLRKQADAHRYAAARSGDGQCDRETHGSQSGGCSREVHHCAW